MNEEIPTIEQSFEKAREEGRQAFNSFREALGGGFQEASGKARAHAEEAAPKVKAVLSDALFDMAYGVSYGTTFAGAFANEFLPENLREGIRKGAEAGQSAAREASEKRESARAQSKEDIVAAVESSDGTAPSPA